MQVACRERTDHVATAARWSVETIGDRDAFAAIEAGLVLGLKLDADVMAEAGIGPFSVSTKKVWNLASFRYPTGLKFGMKAPFHYASNEPFKAPTMDSLEWITPDINVSDMLSKIMASASSKEESV